MTNKPPDDCTNMVLYGNGTKFTKPVWYSCGRCKPCPRDPEAKKLIECELCQNTPLFIKGRRGDDVLYKCLRCGHVFWVYGVGAKDEDDENHTGCEE